MNRPDHQLLNEWHVAINQYHYGENFKSITERQPWMYDAKNIADEIPRLAMLFKAERLGELPTIHQQCSHSEPEKVIDNHLSCCLGVKCKECPFLLALEGTNISRENVDEIKAWTCAAHILSEKSKRMIDDSEGYVLTVNDKMYWQNVYQSLESAQEETTDDDMFCSEHQCEKHLVDYEDGSRYECPECQRERGEALGLL